MASDEIPVWLLADLASVEDQRRYIISATIEEYLLPRDLLLNALHFCERVDGEEGLTANQLEAVIDLRDALDRHFDCHESYSRETIIDLIEHDVHWALLRDLAGKAVKAFSQN
jgi:hypothetical protein